eukprot:366523-Chlamydomonas_euryale.AAC.11
MPAHAHVSVRAPTPIPPPKPGACLDGRARQLAQPNGCDGRAAADVVPRRGVPLARCAHAGHVRARTSCFHATRRVSERGGRRGPAAAARAGVPERADHPHAGVKVWGALGWSRWPVSHTASREALEEPEKWGHSRGFEGGMGASRF